MEQGRSRPSEQPGGAIRASWRGDLVLLGVLLLGSAAIHGWLIWHTEVPASDGVAFIRYAWQLRHAAWGTVFREFPQHPGYPMMVLALSVPLCQCAGGVSGTTLLLSAQLVNSLAGCLLVVPMFFLGRELFDRRVGFWAAALFQCLPATARVTSDALSEGVFLVVAASALLLAVRALRSRSTLGFGLCGACGGLSYLVRPEGALAVAATALVLLGVQVFAAQRWPWRKLLSCAAALSLAALLVAAPYVLTIGRITGKPTGQRVLGLACVDAGDAQGPRPPAAGRPQPIGSAVSTAGVRPMAMILGLWSSGDRGRLGWSFWAVPLEVIKGSHYLAALALVFGWCWHRRLLQTLPGAWVLLLLATLQGLVIWRVAWLIGYTSERHVLVIVMCGVFWATAALLELSQRLTPRLRASALRRGAWGNLDCLGWWRRPAVWSVLPVLAVMAGSLPKALQPLHPERVGHRAAGLWLAEHAGPADAIVDPTSWASLYAGRLFQQERPPASPRPEGGSYVVVDRSKNEHGQVSTTQADDLAKQGTVVYDWKPTAGSPRRAGEVRIYFVPSSRPAR